MTMHLDDSGLYVPPAVRDTFKKASKDAPRTGDAFGAWAGRDLNYLQMPGGAVLQFDLSKLTLGDFRSMKDHYQVNISLAVLTFMMHQIDWHIECEDKEIAAFVEEELRNNWTSFMRAMSPQYWAGFAPAVIEWKNDPDGVRIRRFKDLLPEEATVNWKQVEGYAPEGHIPPKFYEYDGIKQAGQRFPIPPENTVWAPLLMEGGDYYGRKLLRPAFPAWFFSMLIHLFSNRYFERFGEPVPIGRADFNAEVKNAAGVNISGRAAMEEVLTNLRNRSVVVLSSEREPTMDGRKGEYLWDIEYLESQMRGADFERYLFRLDEEISLALFTPTLLVRTSDVGSYNLGVGHLQMYLWLLNALAADLRTYVEPFVVERIAKFNFPGNKKPVKWVPRRMGKQQAEVLRAVVSALIATGTVKPDLDELGDAIGLKLEEVELLTAPELDDEGNPIKPAPTAAPAKDKRVRQRPLKPQGSTVTASRIKERIAGQFRKAVKDGTIADLAPEPGHRSQLLAAYDGDEEAVEEFFQTVNAYLALMCVAVGAGHNVEDALSGFDAMVDAMDNRADAA